MQPDIYTLPTISFVGGSTQELLFHLKDHLGRPFDAVGCAANFAVCDYRNKNAEPLFTVTPTFRENEDTGLDSDMYVRLEPSHTRARYGKYIYQITIVDGSGRYGVPDAGRKRPSAHWLPDMVPLPCRSVVR